MIQINDVDDAGTIGGSNATLTPRNSLRNYDALSRRLGSSFLLAAEVVATIWQLAERSSNSEQSTASLTLLNAVTLLRRQHYTEAFVIGWSFR